MSELERLRKFAAWAFVQSQNLVLRDGAKITQKMLELDLIVIKENPLALQYYLADSLEKLE